MVRVTGDWLTQPQTQAVCAMLTDAGHQAYFVGGCVRNALLRAPVSDLDISTDAHPDRVMELAEAAGLNAVPTGIDHGTVTVISGRIAHEITTYRKDVETDGRRAVVAFADTMVEDAERRDFTMNALYCDAAGTVVDPLGQGLTDLAARRFRFINDPAQRIREDYLRILRYFRFHAWYGDADAGLDAEALAAIAANLAGLETLSRERVGAELIKLLSAPAPEQAVAAMRQSGALAMVLAGVDDRALGPLVHLEQQVGMDPDGIRRLAALGGDEDGRGLRLSNQQRKRLAIYRDHIGTTEGPGELGYRHGADMARGIVLLRCAMLEIPLMPDSFAAIDRGAAAVFPLKAADLLDQFPGRFHGRALGDALRRLERVWIASDFTADRAHLLAAS